jgi:O-acetyl-ADP-ribose deacetylase (regulator of RNase III)
MFAPLNPRITRIDYVSGDATAPIGSGQRIIVHVCNDIGAWGKGFVMAVSRKWPLPERHYRNWHRQLGENLPLGAVQFVEVAADIRVANLVGQHEIKRQNNETPIRYDAIRVGLASVAGEAVRLRASIHMPRIGTGLAGGSWGKIAQIIEQELCSKGIAVTVYDLPA